MRYIAVIALLLAISVIIQCNPEPTSQPSTEPSGQPSKQPSAQPSKQPSTQPSRQPSSQPSMQPSAQPAVRPTSQPTSQPSVQPSMQPVGKPSAQPSSQPTRQPTHQPFSQPTASPSTQPTTQPTGKPSQQPTCIPTAQPSLQPSCQPTSRPTGQEVLEPTSHPSTQPTGVPTSAAEAVVDDLGGGAIAGIVIGSLFGAAMIGAGMWYYYTYFGNAKVNPGVPSENEARAPHNPQQGGQATVQLRNLASDRCITWDESKFARLDGAFRSKRTTAQLCVATLSHLGGRGDIATDFPNLPAIAGMSFMLSSDAPFQEYFDYGLLPNDVLLRAAAVQVLLRLLDNHVRSSLLFCQDPQFLAALYPDPSTLEKRLTGDAKSMLRKFISEKWQQLFADLLANPSLALSSSNTLDRVTFALRALQCTLDAGTVLQQLRTFLQVTPATAKKLTMFAVATALSPESLTLATAPLTSTVFDKTKQDVINETGEGAVQAIVTIIPSLVQETAEGDRVSKGKVVVYKVLG